MGARKSLLDLGRKYRVRTELFIFNITLEKCLERDIARSPSVGARVIEEQHRLFQQAQKSIVSEGFDQIVELKEEDLQSVRFEILYRPINPLNGIRYFKDRHRTPE